MIEEHLRGTWSGLTVADVVVVYVTGRDVFRCVNNEDSRTFTLAAFQENCSKLIGGQPLNGDDIERCFENTSRTWNGSGKLKVRFVLGEFSERETNNDLFALGAPGSASNFLGFVNHVKFIAWTFEIENS